jgi:glycosyltransferase involved in cell wall biosynthesis
LPQLTAALRAQVDLVLIIDDGNAEPEASAIAALHAPAHGVEVLRLPHNQGKGAAVQAGFREAIGRGFTHALQIDADGQHDAADLPRVLEAARAQPDALICGRPIYDESAPKSRRIGRWITHFWVWVETLSFDIEDSMCGFRIYPLAAVEEVVGRRMVGRRMDFDTEIAVRLHWRGITVANIPTKVIYPQENTSNFRMLADNVAISLMHTRLALQAPLQWPRRWARRLKARADRPVRSPTKPGRD